MIYVLDTSTISQVYRSYYRDRFPSFWGLFDALVQEGRARSVSEVEAELSRRYGLEAAIRDLKRLQPGFFALPTPEEQQFIGRIFAIPHFQQLINAKAIAEGTPVADPYLIAKAGASLEDCALVTEEKSSPNAARIPNVCEHFGMDCISLEDLMQREGWQF